MAAGITQTGVGATILFEDESNADASLDGIAGSYSDNDVALKALASGDWVTLGTTPNAYRSKVSLQNGDGSGSAATTLLLKNATILFDSGKTLAVHLTGAATRTTRFGTKVGSGNRASGTDACALSLQATTTMRGIVQWYAAQIRMQAGTLNMTPGDLNGSELVDCILDSRIATGVAFVAGGASARFSNLYNLDMSAVTSGVVCSQLSAQSCERVTISAPAPQAFLSTATPNIANKDISVFGSPTISDFRWGTIGGLNWRFVRPRFSGNAPKFSGVSVGVPGLTDATWEMRLFGSKVVDKTTGSAISGIPIRVTDPTAATTIFEGVTDAYGAIFFNNVDVTIDIFDNAVAVADHYLVGSTYSIRKRSPFRTEVNYGAGANPAYESLDYLWNWPGDETVTTSTGEYSDVNDPIPLGPPSTGGGYSGPIPAEGTGIERATVKMRNVT